MIQIGIYIYLCSFLFCWRDECIVRVEPFMVDVRYAWILYKTQQMLWNDVASWESSLKLWKIEYGLGNFLLAGRWGISSDLMAKDVCSEYLPLPSLKSRILCILYVEEVKCVYLERFKGFMHLNRSLSSGLLVRKPIITFTDRKGDSLNVYI